jgi:hypothetical protein
MSGGRRALLVVTILAASSCSLTSLEGFSGPGVGPDPDADAASLDDSSGASDGPDVNTIGTPDGGRFCASLSASAPAPVFCSDFDDGALPGVWTRIDVGAPNTITLDGVESTSLPQALLVTVMPGASGTPVCLEKDLPGPYEDIRVELDFRLEVVGVMEPFDLVDLMKTDSEEVTIQVTPGGVIQLEEDWLEPSGTKSEGVVDTSGRATPNAWQHLTIRAQRSASATQVVVSVDGRTSAPYVVRSRTFLAGFSAGLSDCYTRETNGTWKVRFDNFVVYAR